MNDGKSISVWYTEDERRSLEQAAALAGYRHLSKYIRDKSLNAGRHRTTADDSVEAWAERQELTGRLAEIERDQKAAHALLAMLLFLVRRKATTGEINELVLACEHAGAPAEVLAGSLPEFAALLDRFTEDS
ncbi:hypothetical protein AWB81_07135 [Caballeronia arationis]|uniref:hypothetical protein n=1 Tax=Caballeronia arationis TaxID=1777142 RepID=UPI00074CF7EA|nr:hypothetical protein [Caballeronia arationis]SAL05374.1 hypothetical protein AWB81_07135 [Caballeronia arationis]